MWFVIQLHCWSTCIFAVLVLPKTFLAPKMITGTYFSPSQTAYLWSHYINPLNKDCYCYFVKCDLISELQLVEQGMTKILVSLIGRPQWPIKCGRFKPRQTGCHSIGCYPHCSRFGVLSPATSHRLPIEILMTNYVGLLPGGSLWLAVSSSPSQATIISSSSLAPVRAHDMSAVWMVCFC